MIKILHALVFAEQVSEHEDCTHNSRRTDTNLQPAYYIPPVTEKL